MLVLDRRTWLQILAEAWRVYPEEACGLLVAAGAEGAIERFVPVRNETASSRVFTLDAREYLRAERQADDDGLDVVGVVHSHTHTAAYPSPTDVAEATKPMVPPSWHWTIVSLAWGYPELRSFRVSEPSTEPRGREMGMQEEPVLLKG